jgi:hypothetical protein
MAIENKNSEFAQIIKNDECSNIRFLKRREIQK